MIDLEAAGTINFLINYKMGCLIKFIVVFLTVTGWGVLASVGLIAAERAVPQPVAVRPEKNQLVVTVGDKVFTCYKFARSQKYPYFWPVNGPISGRSITTESSQPYPHHHSLFFGCDRVNGGNYWQESNERGQIVSQGPKIIEASGDRVVFIDECFWQQPGKEPVICDLRRVVITAPSKDLRFIDFEISLEPLVDVCILKTNHSLFSARLVPELSADSGGTLVNAEGKTGEKGTWGVTSPWCDYAGMRGGATEGIAILQHPDNRWFPAKWFTRDYGFFSPTPMFWPEGDRTELPKGDVLTLRYRVVVHAGDVEAAGIKEIFRQYGQAANTVSATKVQTNSDTKMKLPAASCRVSKAEFSEANNPPSPSRRRSIAVATERLRRVLFRLSILRSSSPP